MKIRRDGKIIGTKDCYYIGSQIYKIIDKLEKIEKEENIRKKVKLILENSVPIKEDEMNKEITKVTLNNIEKVENIKKYSISNTFILKEEDKEIEIEKGADAYRQYAIASSKMKRGTNLEGETINIELNAIRAKTALTESDAIVIRKRAIRNMIFYIEREKTINIEEEELEKIKNKKSWLITEEKKIKCYNPIKEEIKEKIKVKLMIQCKITDGTKVTDKYGNKGVITVLNDANFEKLLSSLEKINKKEIKLIDMIWNPTLEKRGIRKYQEKIHKVILNVAEPPKIKVYKNISLSTGWFLLKDMKIYKKNIDKTEVRNILKSINNNPGDSYIEIKKHLGSAIVRGAALKIEEKELENTVLDKRTEKEFSIIKLPNGKIVVMPPRKIVMKDGEPIVDELRRRFNRIIMRLNTPSGMDYLTTEIKKYKKELIKSLTGKNGAIRKMIFPKAKNSYMMVAVPSEKDIIVPKWMINSNEEYAFIFRHPIHCCSDILPVKIKRGTNNEPVIRVPSETMKKMCGDFDGDQLGIILPEDEEDRIEIKNAMKDWESRMFPEEELERIKTKDIKKFKDDDIEKQIKDGIKRKMLVKILTSLNGAFGIKLICEAIEKEKDKDEIDLAAFVYKLVAQDALEFKHREIPENTNYIDLALAYNEDFRKTIEDELIWHEDGYKSILYKTISRKTVLKEDELEKVINIVKKLI